MNNLNVNSLGSFTPQSPFGQLSLADSRFVLDSLEGEVYIDDQLRSGIFTPTEFYIAEVIASHSDIMLGARALTEEVTGRLDQQALGTVFSHLSSIRNKIGPELGNPRDGVFRTVPHVGIKGVSSLTGMPTAEILKFNKSLADGRVKVNHLAWLAIADETVIERIPAVEFVILDIFANNPDKTISHDKFKLALRRILGVNTEQQNLAVRVSQLRQRFPDDLGNAKTGFIRTIVGRGYEGRSSLVVHETIEQPKQFNRGKRHPWHVNQYRNP